MNGHEGHDRRSIGDLLKELRDESIVLMRQEVALAKAEVAEKIQRTMKNTGYIAVGGAVAFAGLFFLLLAASQAIAGILVAAGAADMAPWLAPLIVGVIVGIAGLLMVMKGKKTLEKESIAPEHTVGTLKDNKQWVKEKLQ
jgi:hypothetical protein